ncbi:hypothetical protein Hanom_Chr11g01016511 [Helianthus anomalus]
MKVVVVTHTCDGDGGRWAVGVSGGGHYISSGFTFLDKYLNEEKVGLVFCGGEKVILVKI